MRTCRPSLVHSRGTDSHLTRPLADPRSCRYTQRCWASGQSVFGEQVHGTKEGMRRLAWATCHCSSCWLCSLLY